MFNFNFGLPNSVSKPALLSMGGLQHKLLPPSWPLHQDYFRINEDYEFLSMLSSLARYSFNGVVVVAMIGVKEQIGDIVLFQR